MAKRARKTKKENKTINAVTLGLADRVFPLIVEFDVRAMVENIRKNFAVFLTEKEIENALLDILWRVHEANPNIADRKITTKSLGRITFELSFCPVPVQGLSEENFQKLINSALVNKPVGT